MLESSIKELAVQSSGIEMDRNDRSHLCHEVSGMNFSDSCEATVRKFVIHGSFHGRL